MASHFIHLERHMHTIPTLEFPQEGNPVIKIYVCRLDWFNGPAVSALHELAKELREVQTIDGGLRIGGDCIALHLWVRVAERYPRCVLRGIARQLNVAVCNCLNQLPVEVATFPATSTVH